MFMKIKNAMKIQKNIKEENYICYYDLLLHVA